MWPKAQARRGYHVELMQQPPWVAAQKDEI
jgi:hypothetical protein